ncbi:MAG: hypothetical protein ACT4QD_17280 [Acidobacteriota bacterium]
MVSRRELITTGLAGSLPSAAASSDMPAPVAEQQADREGQREIARQVQGIESVLRDAHLSSALAHGFVGKLRADMTQFLRANSKFPDFIEIGIAVFFDVYDWHVKHRQQLVVTRLADGRYAMQFMFSSLVLRPEQDPSYVGIPFDKA